MLLARRVNLNLRGFVSLPCKGYITKPRVAYSRTLGNGQTLFTPAR